MAGSMLRLTSGVVSDGRSRTHDEAAAGRPVLDMVSN